uniref:Uncharacterized protein n=1 Tax=Branchiostoma floridae TaxID=7739 RepID=C4A0D2_BRAFL|eukprot:XP_002585739.1 hypothetical protein BRAFLDRAFT_111360 [Branchiostoma floridae]
MEAAQEPHHRPPVTRHQVSLFRKWGSGSPSPKGQGAGDPVCSPPPRVKPVPQLAGASAPIILGTQYPKGLLDSAVFTTGGAFKLWRTPEGKGQGENTKSEDQQARPGQHRARTSALCVYRAACVL